MDEAPCYSRWMRVAFIVSALAMFLLGCGGETRTLTQHASPDVPDVTPTTSTPTRVPVAAGSVPACRQDQLAAEAKAPVGATAMMSLNVIIANTGEVPCSLGPPELVELHLPGDPSRVFHGRLKKFDPLVLFPSRAPSANEPASPPDAADIWLVWTWRTHTGCEVIEPPGGSVFLGLAGPTSFQLPAQIQFWPCSDDFSVAGFGPVRD